MTSTEQPPSSPSLSPASVTWGADGVPRSDTFGDVYFSLHNGWAESRHAFFDGAEIALRWAEQDRFSIGETGFGTGRNFLLTWQAWRADPARPQTLDYISVEGFPLSKADLTRALQGVLKAPELDPLAEQLCAAWPEAHPGFHLRLFDQGRVRLLLLFGEVSDILSQLSPPPGGGLDAWYLDGFAPAKNPGMWQASVYQQVARLAKPGCRFGTYAAAGHVRRGLCEVGFAVNRRPGHGYKRESLAGVYQPTVAPIAQHKPWLRPPAPLARGATVAVIGGGIAGCALAAALCRLGLQPTLIERHQDLAQEGSGNPCGLLKPRLTADGGIHGRFYAQATLYAQTILPPEGWVSKGIFHLARSVEDAALQARLAQTLAPGHAVPLSPSTTKDITGLSTDHGGLWFPYAGAIRPQAVCTALVQQTPADAPVIHQTAIAPQPVPTGDGRWMVGEKIYDAVVLCAGAYGAGLWPAAELPIHSNRGQISVIEQGDAILPEPALSFGGYLSPAFSDPAFAAGKAVRVLGATYRRLPRPDAEDWRCLSDTDHQAVAEELEQNLPAVAKALSASTRCVGGRAALRATIADHMPLAGPLFDAELYRQDFADLHHGRRPATYPPARWAEGLYILGGLGSRGFQTAPLLAEHLAAMMTGGPSPLPDDIAEAVHPARFLIRTLRKAPKRGRTTAAKSEMGKKISPAAGHCAGD